MNWKIKMSIKDRYGNIVVPDYEKLAENKWTAELLFWLCILLWSIF